ncbi:MAG: adenylate/guanylate cyclase domain-containing protein [Eubacteriales bacterium]
MKINPTIRKILAAAICAAILTAICASGVLFSEANTVNDAFYQRPTTPAEEIVIIGIDEYAIGEFGVFPWPRDIIAMALDYLNADPENAPAVIAVDTVYAGYSDGSLEATDIDLWLADAAGYGDNVVMASFATYGTQLVTTESGDFYMDDYSVLAFDEPFPELAAATELVHINAMLDNDGILRHAIWQIDLPDGRTIPSFHQSVAKKYVEAMGLPDIEEPPTDARHHWYLPMQSTPFAMDDGFSIADLVYGELDPAFFADKIVLIGPFTAGLMDEYYTAIDHSQAMYGVEYQANAIAALLRGETKYEVATAPQMVCLFVLVFGFFYWLQDRKMLPATLVWFVGSAGWVGLCLLLWNMGYVVYILYFPMCLTITYVVSIALNYGRAALEKHRVSATFRRYVAPEIVSELLEGDPASMELGGRMVDIAVLFVDIRGFTPMSEALDPPTVVEIINKYLTLTSDCIFRNNGTLDKYVGDCTMAFWGAPLPQDDCIFKAVKAGLDMVEGSKALGKELQEKFGRSVDFGVGVNFGPAVVGNIGSTIRMDYTAIGDTVNTAARLEANAPAGQLLVSRVVADALEGRVEFTSLGNTIRLKGKTPDFEILRVEGLTNPSTAMEGE